MNHALIQILDDEFAKRRGASEMATTSVAEMARHLGLDKGVLSRLRSGERPISEAKARQIAVKLRGKGNAADELVSKLLATNPDSNAPQLGVEEWFRARSKPRHAMFVEFGELPVVRPGGGHDASATVVSDAVATGLAYGMFFPFNPSVSDWNTSPFVKYQLELRDAVLDTYSMLLDRTLSRVCELHYETPGQKAGPKELRAQLTDAAKRLQCYCLLSDVMPSFPGVGHRTFLTVRPSLTLERWEWVSIPGGRDEMIARQLSDTDMRLIKAKFFPIVEFWLDDDRGPHLPQSNTELQQFHKHLMEGSTSLVSGVSSIPFYSKLRWDVCGEGFRDRILGRHLKNVQDPSPAKPRRRDA